MAAASQVALRPPLPPYNFVRECIGQIGPQPPLDPWRAASLNYLVAASPSLLHASLSAVTASDVGKVGSSDGNDYKSPRGVL